MMKKKVIVGSIMIAALLMATIPVDLRAASEKATVQVGAKSYAITAEQLKKIQSQPGVESSKTLPEALPSSQIAVTIPEELGGGYLIGEKDAIAAAFNSAGITVGLTGAAILTQTQIIAGISVVTLAGVLAAATSGGGTSTRIHLTPIHPVH